MEIKLNSNKNLAFTKMHGCGNDFVVIDAINQNVPVAIRAKLCRKLSERNFGVGCDQILFVEKPKNPAHDFYYGIYNSDGSISGQCGNGARCFAFYVQNKKLTPKNNIVLGVLGGVTEVSRIKPLKPTKISKNPNIAEFLVNMSAPIFTASKIPFLGEIAKNGTAKIKVQNKIFTVSPVSMGNPHSVIVVKDVKNYPVCKIGAQIENHPSFPQRVNVGFMEIVNVQEIFLRVFERGTGETLACGSGACAAVVSGIMLGKLTANKPISVQLPGGTLVITWSGNPEDCVFMQGPAEFIFEGTININNL